jgi:hypothetical protein
MGKFLANSKIHQQDAFLAKYIFSGAAHPEKLVILPVGFLSKLRCQ